MAEFLASIGIEMRAGVVDVPTIFPGSLIDQGSLVIDGDNLVAPGDALHEAAHIALVPVPRKSRLQRSRSYELRHSGLKSANSLAAEVRKLRPQGSGSAHPEL